jgi:hypothetical protein
VDNDQTCRVAAPQQGPPRCQEAGWGATTSPEIRCTVLRNSVFRNARQMQRKSGLESLQPSDQGSFSSIFHAALGPLFFCHLFGANIENSARSDNNYFRHRK